ncbi:F-box only protein 39 [Aplysia californica]|uniref:F-box only protein 39 n=1 Tax=Aplysia californica TaxID=6500 RepID=A0ABM1AAD8_APLCA|nr:F-box only protein 39 [Aplysia californica]
MPKVTKKGRKAHRVCRNNTWSELPYPALVEVYRNLHDKDRVAAAQVCHMWGKAFTNPALWRSKHFVLGGSKANSSGQRAVVFAQKMGPCLRHVYIKCRHLTSNTCETIASSLEQFCSNLEHSRLEHLVIRELELDRFWKHAHLRPKVAQCLQNMLRSQRNLQLLDLSTAQFGVLPGSEVLAAASEGSGSKISCLELPDFFHTQLAAFEIPAYVKAILGFSNLQQINLNYCCLSDHIVEQWAKVLAGKLEDLEIRVCSNEPHTHRISNESWSLLKAACPRLTVDMSILGIGPASSVIPILAPPIPLVYLHYWSGHDGDTELGLHSTLRHIAAHYASSLKQLSLDFDNLHDRINEQLIALVARCRRLTSLRIKAIADVQVADTICQMIQERENCLRDVSIMLCDLAEPELELLQDLRERLAPFVESRDINITLRNDMF